MDCRNLNLDEVMDAVGQDDNIGFCKFCGDMAFGIEPDAQNYMCESCGKHQVFGAEQLLIEMAP